MVELQPFFGIGYSPKLNPLNNFLTLPFDEIDNSLKEEYLKRSEYNFVRINLPEKHEDSLKIIRNWLRKGIFVKDHKAHIYPYLQKFTIGEKYYERWGFFSTVAADFSFSEILPHENIYLEPKNERLELLKATNMDIEPIFFLYNDPQGKCNYIYKVNDPILYGIEPKGIENYLFVSDENVELCNEFKIVIADGHHRYSAALEYAKIKPKSKYIMGIFVNVHDPGLILLPSYKKVKNIPENFNIKNFEKYFSIEEVNEIKINKGFFIIIYKNRFYKLKLKDKFNFGSDTYSNLGSVIFQKIIMDKILNLPYDIRYVETFHNLNFSIEKDSMAILFEQPSPIDVWNIAMNGEKMPQKSTYFYPKPVSGLRLNKK